MSRVVSRDDVDVVRALARGLADDPLRRSRWERVGEFAGHVVTGVIVVGVVVIVVLLIVAAVLALWRVILP